MNIEDVTLTVVDALDAEGIAYLLAGSFSSNYYGIPRSTQDADFVIETAGKSLIGLRQRLGPEFQFDPQMSFETVTGTYRNVIDVRGMEFKVELFRLSDDPHDRERFRRRQHVDLFGRRIALPTAEDVIITKLRWLRGKDRDDARDVIAVQGERIDWEYVYSWCDQHVTRQVLDEIRRSIPPI